MYLTIEEGLKAYKEKVKKYLAFYEGLGLKKDDDPRAVLDTHNWNLLLEWNNKMDGMVEALGLSEDEMKSIDASLGV